MQIFVDAGGTHLRHIEKDGKNETYFESRSAQTGLLQMLDERLRILPNVDFVGVSFAGQVHAGHILSSPNLDIKPMDFEGYMLEKYGIKAKIQNDLKCAALAESALRPNAQSIAVLFIGTGFGGAFTQNGSLIEGCFNKAGEIGHIPFRPCNAVCGCGQNDCVELYASGSGLVKQANLAGLQMPKVRLGELSTNTDPKAKKVVELFYSALSHAVKTVSTLLDPAVIVLGGGIALSNKEIADFVEKQLNGRNLGGSAKVELSTLDNASLAGAGLLR